MKKLSFNNEWKGERLDRVIARAHPEISRRAAKSMVEAGQVFVDGRRTKISSLALNEGARIVIHADAPDAPPEVPILFEDASLLVIDKPIGMHLNETETSASFAATRALGDRELFLVHRIDRDTSGVVMLAKTVDLAAELSAAFQARTVEKRYLAIVSGTVPDGWIEAPIGKDKKRPRARMVAADGKTAATKVTTLATVGELSSILAEPITGRTHQIRVHLAHAGAPILGDTLYGGKVAARVGEQVVRAERPLLHAWRLELSIGGQRRSFEAPFPSDLKALEALGLLLDGSARA